MLTICPLCQQVHLYPLQDRICKVRLQIINLRLEERDLIKQLKENKMLSYHNDPELKRQFVALLKWHQEQDKIIKGIYADNPRNGIVTVNGFELPAKFRGCAVGCSINSLRAITGRTDIEYGDHAAYEELIGVPRILARLSDGIFEHLPDGLYQEWPVRFAEAIPGGVDLSLVWPKFAVWLLVDEVDGVIKFARTDQQRDAIQNVANLYTLVIEGRKVPTSTWQSAAAAAYADGTAAAAAAYAAYAYAYATAKTNHYIKIADKLIQYTIESVPVR